MESVRTRSRGKQQQQRKGSLREREETTTSDAEDEDEERAVPVVSGENKRKRAPRSGGGRAVKLRTLPRYESGGGGGGGGGATTGSEVSGSTEETRVESGEGDAATSGRKGGEARHQQDEGQDQGGKRRESSRVRIKTIKVRENAEAKAETKPVRVKSDKKEGKDGGGGGGGGDAKEVPKKKGGGGEEAKAAATPEMIPSQRPLKVHLNFSDSKRKAAASPAPPVESPVAAQRKVTKSMSSTPSLSSPVRSPPVESTPPPPPQQQPGELREEELDTSLKVIKKLMKMDASHPFNKPVDPEGQGVPDYLEIIDTPMDFGTISENLEKRQKYRNAAEVYKDIQQIWINCRKYNHKGDPILELMKKVQKACSKYWTANGVLREGKKSKTGENPTEKPSDIFVAKTTTSTQKPAAVGTSNHKPNCECAVCMNARRRTTRERRAVGLGSARAVKRQIAKMKGKQDLNEHELEELAQLEEVYHDQVEEEEHFYPASYQIPLRAVNPVVLSMGQALFTANLKKTYPPTNPFAELVSAYTT